MFIFKQVGATLSVLNVCKPDSHYLTIETAHRQGRSTDFQCHRQHYMCIF